VSYSARTRRRRRGAGPGRYFLLAFLFLLLCGTLTGAAAGGWVFRTATSAPPLSSLTLRDPGGLSVVFAADGKTRLGFIQSDDLVTQVSTKDIPDVLKEATVAIEDERFYDHKGVDYEGIVRAAVKNATSKETVQGGSTLTMQLVRNLYTQDKTRAGLEGYKRKIREARLAQELETKHSKEWLLGKYINTVPYGTVGGQSAIGAGAAARLYFNKRVQDLTLREAALLAGLPQAPSTYSPTQNPDGAKARRNAVLAKMAELGKITPQRARAEMAKGLGLQMEDYFQKARERYVLDYVQSELLKEYGSETMKRGGLRVYTTIDLKKQRWAREAIATKMGDIGPSAAIVSINPHNGDIVAMASSAAYGKSKYNLAAQGHRQPGSAFKTMALMAALREGVNPDSTSYVSRSPTKIDSPVCGAPFEVKTYSGSGRGSISLHSATLSSDNSVYIQLAADLGPDKVKETARMMGIKSKLMGYCAETLGGLEDGVSPLEMASAYATIANGGSRNRPRVIRKVTTREGRSELPKRWRVHRTKAFSDGVTYEATKILEANMRGGTGTHAQIGCPAAGKTGTTDKNIDAWFVGFTPKLSTAVWVGYPNSNKISMNGLYFGRNVDGGTYPADIWGHYMKKAVGRSCGDFERPTEPFQSQPFFGHYARSGRDDDDDDQGSGQTSPSAPQEQEGPDEEPRQTEPGNGEGNGNGRGDNGAGGGGGNPQPTPTNGDATFDPNQYETPPQPPPQTQTPGGGTQAPPGDG
jgi:penicillin-binding protein 1A